LYALLISPIRIICPAHLTLRLTALNCEASHYVNFSMLVLLPVSKVQTRVLRVFSSLYSETVSA
jgi:hypothetical protein